VRANPHSQAGPTVLPANLPPHHIPILVLLAGSSCCTAVGQKQREERTMHLPAVSSASEMIAGYVWEGGGVWI
jgi:hypothetical protein